MAANPLHQFEVHEIARANLLGMEIQITNQSTWMVIAVASLIAFLMIGSRKRALVPGRMQSLVELTYEFIHKLVKETAGSEALKFFPVIFTLFLFIAVLNLFGMIPGSYTSTSQIFITGTLSLCVFASVIAIGFYKHGFKFLGLFVPSGVPVALIPLIVPLELISFFARPFTLALRLAANMVAGHILLKIIAMFIVMMLSTASFVAAASVVPMVLLIALTGLEVFVALLQAYIFTVLACVYLNDALHLH